MFWPLKNNNGAQKLESQFIKAVQPFSWLEVEDHNDPDTTLCEPYDTWTLRVNAKT